MSDLRQGRARRLLVIALELALGALFVYAGALKLVDPTSFSVEISNYHLLPQLAPVLATLLPGLELICGLCLCLFSSRSSLGRAATLWISLMLLAFTVAVTSVVLRGIDVSCGCFGSGSGNISWLTVLRDLALLALAIFLLIKRGMRPANSV